jgi:hypothetical protein
MKVGYKMDYGKVADILAVIYNDGVDVVAVE